MIDNIKIRDCDTCASFAQLLDDIDCKIKELSVDLYNNVIFALNLAHQGHSRNQVAINKNAVDLP